MCTCMTMCSVFVIFWVSVIFLCKDAVSSQEFRANRFIDHFEPLFYDTRAVLYQHRRAKRSVTDEVTFDIEAYGQLFCLHLKSDPSIFSENVQLLINKTPVYFEKDFTYTGSLRGDPLSKVYGVLTKDGVFEGTIITDTDSYQVEAAKRYFNHSTSFHSIMYKHSGINTSAGLDYASFESQKVHKQLLEKQPLREKLKPPHRRKRAYDKTLVTCPMYLQVDHLYYEFLNSDQNEVLTQLAEYIQAVNEIYPLIDFDKDGEPDGVNFVIKRIKVYTDDGAQDYPYKGNYGVEAYLNKFSQSGNFTDYCLAFLFTYRDFDGGTLGLAWTGSIDKAGGVCEKYDIFNSVGTSLNTGIVTRLNFGDTVPFHVSQLTFAHEIGHDMGSQHDEEGDCVPGGNQGNFIMYDKSTTGLLPNNRKFSPCSINYMNTIFQDRARHPPPAGCFLAEKGSICGNRVVEEGEACDCGWEEDCKEICCNAKKEVPTPGETPCQLKSSAQCSPSEGSCCTDTCNIRSVNETYPCTNQTDCRHTSYCNGVNATCPASLSKPDKINCTDHVGREYVCLQGECSGSICVAFDLDPCQCEPAVLDTVASWSDPLLCQLCCKDSNNTGACKSTHYWADRIPGMIGRDQYPGKPCYNNQGFCDVFQVCREVDPTGPLNALKNFIFSEQGLETVKEWLISKWYIVVVSALVFFAGMALFVKFCSVKVPKDTDHKKVKKKWANKPAKKPTSAGSTRPNKIADSNV